MYTWFLIRINMQLTYIPEFSAWLAVPLYLLCALSVSLLLISQSSIKLVVN